MKKIISSLFVLLIAVSAFAQYGINIQKPVTGGGTTSSPQLSAVSLDGTKVYAYNFINYYYSSLDLPGYNNLTSVNYSESYVGGVDFDNEGNMYAITANGGNLWIEDFETGSITNLGTVAGIPTNYLVGLAFDNQTGKLYYMQCDWGSAGNLYSIDISTMTATLIGSLAGMPNCEGIAFNASDRMLYGFNFQSAQTQLYKINPSTAATTLVGTTTSFLNYTNGWFGDCDFNDLNGELIYSTFDDNTTVSTIWSIDVSNFTPTLEATVSNAQLVLAVNTNGKPVHVKWYYFILVFLIPVGIIIRRRFI